jgi:hypothetical protein
MPRARAATIRVARPAITARLRSSLHSGQSAISPAVLPHPMQTPLSGSITQILTQGETGFAMTLI